MLAGDPDKVRQLFSAEVQDRHLECSGGTVQTRVRMNVRGGGSGLEFGSGAALTGDPPLQSEVEVGHELQTRVRVGEHKHLH